MTNEQKSWQLHEHGVTYGEVASFANIFECSMEAAVEELWEVKVMHKPANPQFNCENWMD